MVLIDTDMPKNCYECPFLMGDRESGIIVCGICDEVVDISEIDQKRSDVCPMIGVAEPPKIETYSFPEVFGEPIEMLVEGVWIKGKVINDYRSRDGIVNMETADGKKYWCGCERTDCYRRPKEDK